MISVLSELRPKFENVSSREIVSGATFISRAIRSTNQALIASKLYSLTLAIAALIAAAYRRTHRQPPHASPVPVSSFHRVGLDRGEIAQPITPALERIERDVVPCPSASPVQRDEINGTASDIKFRKSLNERGPLRQIARLQRRQPNCPSVGEMLAPELSE